MCLWQSLAKAVTEKILYMGFFVQERCVPITAFECVFSHCSWVYVLAAAVAQASCPSLSVSGKNGCYVIVSSLFQSAGKWPKMKPSGTGGLTH